MVQYKAMEKGSDGPEFRWKAKDQLAVEIARMDQLLITLKAQPEDPAQLSTSHEPVLPETLSQDHL